MKCNQEEARVTMFTEDEVDFMISGFTRNKADHFSMIKGSNASRR